MIDIKLNPATWDLELVQGELTLVTDDDTTVQHIRQRLLAFRAEWFLDLSLGVPWLQEILGKPQDISIVEAELKRCILETPDVAELLEFSLDEADGERTIAVNFACRLTSGENVTNIVEITG